MTISRRDYQLIASVLKERGDEATTKRLADAFEENNSSFNREKFLKAAGVDQ